jgi:hypothetical protein
MALSHLVNSSRRREPQNFSPTHLASAGPSSSSCRANSALLDIVTTSIREGPACHYLSPCDSIGLFGVPYNVTFLWSSLIDRVPIPVLTRRLGRRRSCLLAIQLALVGATGPREAPLWTALAVLADGTYISVVVKASIRGATTGPDHPRRH